MDISEIKNRAYSYPEGFKSRPTEEQFIEALDKIHDKKYRLFTTFKALLECDMYDIIDLVKIVNSSTCDESMKTNVMNVIRNSIGPELLKNIREGNIK